MADIGVYFDGSGLGGVVGDEGLWADVVNWEGELPGDHYPTIHHLIERGWEDDLPELKTDLEGAVREHAPARKVAKGIAELLSIIQDRADGDEAAAVALVDNGDGEEEEEPATNELSHQQISSQLEKLLAEKFSGVLTGDAGAGMGSVRPADMWPVDVYDDYFIYRNGSKTYSQDYTLTDKIVKLKGEPVEVVRVTEYVPVKNDDGTLNVELVENARGGGKGKGAPSSRLNISPDKACQILKDGQVRGHPLTDRQRGLFGTICGRKKKVRNEETSNTDADATDLEEVREAVKSIGVNGDSRPSRGEAVLAAVRNAVRGVKEEEGDSEQKMVRDVIREGILYSGSQEEDVRETVRKVAANQDAGDDT